MIEQTDKGWFVDVTISGKRVRKTFGSKSLAEAYVTAARHEQARKRLGLKDLTPQQYAIASELSA
jgi:hypothetical protein